MRRSSRSAAASLLCVAALAGACGPAGPSKDPIFGSPVPLTSPPPTATAGSAPPSSAPSPSGSPVPAAELPTSGTWARLEVDGKGPAAREDHTWTVDGDGRVAYLFGGRNGDRVFGDFWAFDLAAGSWTRVAPSGDGPAPRFGHNAVWVPGQGLVVFAGQMGATFYADLWAFDPATGAWRALQGVGAAPVPRYGSCADLGPDGRFWISHGFTEEGTRFSDTRAYDFGAGAWTNETPSGSGPVERCLHECWWGSDGTFTLYGGQTTGVAALGDAWRLQPGAAGHPGTWTKLPKPAPADRQLPAMARLPGATLVLGGRGGDRKPLADGWFLPDGAPSFLPLEADAGPAPAGRSGAALIRDPASGRLLLFGGRADDALGDLWELTLR